MRATTGTENPSLSCDLVLFQTQEEAPRRARARALPGTPRQSAPHQSSHLSRKTKTKPPPQKKKTPPQSIERAFVADPVGALPPAAASLPLRPESALDAATAEYLAHAGRFAAAKELVLEAGLFEEGEKDGGEGEQAAAERAAEALVAPFVEAEAALSRLRFPRCDAEPALAWLASKRRAMSNPKANKGGGRRARSGGAARADELEFALLRARFSSVLVGEGPRAALRFVNERMARFATDQGSDRDPSQAKRYLDEILRLMGAVALFQGDDGGTDETPTKRTRAAAAACGAARAAEASAPSLRRRSPRRLLPERYCDLFSRSLWDRAAEDLAAAACELAGAPAKPPLLVAAAAGAAALPTLLKLANKMSAGGPGRTAAVVGGGGGASSATSAAAAAATAAGGADGRASAADFGFGRDERSGGDEENRDDGAKDGDDDAALPVDLNLGPEFAFTTIFSCPVSRDTATRDNPPMLLPCGHVFCRAAVAGISRGGPASRAFKCPLCPTEATPGSCRALVFPPFGAASGGGEEEDVGGEDGGGEDEAMGSD